MIRKELKKVVCSSLVVGLLVASTIPALAANVGGGVWDYGTKISGINRKTVYSNYYHPTKTHSSSVTIGTTSASSGWVSAKSTSYASATGSWSAETHANYNYK